MIIFTYMASIDGNTFKGYSISGFSGGMYGQGWLNGALNLNSIPELGNVCNKNSVWIAFSFSSTISAMVFLSFLQ